MSDEPPPRSASKPIVAISVASIAAAVGLGVLNLLDPSMAGALPDALGTVPGWITSGGIMGILGLLIYWQLGNRKIGIEGGQVENADKADIRDHYAQELASLRERFDSAGTRHALEVAEIEGRYKSLLDDAETRYRDAEARYREAVLAIEEQYKAAIGDAEKRHEDCLTLRDGLRDEVQELKEEIAGVRRQILAQSSDRVLALGDHGALPPSENVKAAARRVRRISRKDPGADKPPKG